MKIGITGKLFLAILATCMLVIVTMNWGARLSFERGFTDYIRHSNEQRFNLLANSLAERYRIEGNWDFLRYNEKQLYRLLRSFDQNDGHEDMPPPPGWRVPFWVFDTHDRLISGSSHPVPNEATRTAITLDGKIIGWIVAVPSEKLTRQADINFSLQQSRTSWILVALSTFLAALMTLLVSRSLLSRVKTLVNATHKLAAGDFSARVAVASKDELGTLANDFNLLAHTLEKNESMRRAFIADVSHELRTPLAVLQGELEAMEDGVRQLTPTSLQSLQAEVSALTKLVNDLHQLSLSDLGALSYKKAPLNVIDVLEQSLAIYRGRFEQKGLDIETSLPPKAVIFGDPDRLAQLFNNLLENSLRYTDTEPGGQLIVSADIGKENLLIRWQDSAPGVTDEQMTQIFERFYRTELSRNRTSGGSGLGLSICWNIVNAHDGCISAAHSPLGGLEIAVTLPLISTASAAVR
ncbi:two-component system sensor histidine kinase BaeS [Leminorella grimontii]|uniref:envelope stress sensor histidine kinase BaeS n=1 Tax=Leminorella grimontii TaxID=82981 RepID=UPI0020863265|nr:two-component system sensor histidine kinase BaeS [Leminorella grimontii]GKX58192.1 two-component sensor histidine kinase [Leminorella grimontii]